MKKFARIQDARVVELISGGNDIAGQFHPDLVWVDVSTVTGIGEGWTYDGSAFEPPPAQIPSPPQPGLPEIRAQLAALLARVEVLAAPAVHD